MIYRSCYTFVVLILCAGLQACSAHKSKQLNIATPFTTYDWETRRPDAHEKIEITYRLPQHARATLTLSEHKSGSKSIPITTVRLTNENCQNGHQAAITYKDKDAYYTRYFTKELSWSDHNTIAIQWLSDDTLQVTANNEALSIPANKLSRLMKVSAQDAPIEIQQVKYISQ